MLLNQLLAEASKLQHAGRVVEWRMVRAPTAADVKLVNAFMVK